MSDHEDLLREHGELKAQVTRLKMELAVAHRERDSARADALEEAAKQCDGWFVPVSTEADIAHNAALSHAGRRIRDLKSTPTHR